MTLYIIEYLHWARNEISTPGHLNVKRIFQLILLYEYLIIRIVCNCQLDEIVV